MLPTRLDASVVRQKKDTIFHWFFVLMISQSLIHKGSKSSQSLSAIMFHKIWVLDDVELMFCFVNMLPIILLILTF